MNVDIFLEAQELYGKYNLCGSILEYLSDEDKPKGQKYLETLKQFAEAFKMEFMAFVHEQQSNVGMQFEDLHCPEHSGVEPPKEPTLPPEDSEFQIGSRVKIINAPIDVFNGRIGTVVDYDPIEGKFAVQVDGFSADALPQWFAEDEIELYAEPEDENPEVSDFKFKEGETVKIISGEYAGSIGIIFDYLEDGRYIISLSSPHMEGSSAYCTEDQLELYTDPETPEEDGAGDTDPTEGE